VIPGLMFVLLLAAVLVCLALADDYDAQAQPAYVPSRPVAIDEGLAWRRFHAEGRLIDQVHAQLAAPVLIGRPPLLTQRRSAQVAA